MFSTLHIIDFVDLDIKINMCQYKNTSIDSTERLQDGLVCGGRGRMQQGDTQGQILWRGSMEHRGQFWEHGIVFNVKVSCLFEYALGSSLYDRKRQKL